MMLWLVWGGAFVLLIAHIAFLQWAIRDRHKWKYRNPYDRTCEICGQHEVEHCWSMNPRDWRQGWWEVFKDGDGKCGNRRFK